MKKAPNEVFVLWPIGEEKGDGLAVRRQTTLKTGVRYIRADLTCGECSHYCRRECPHRQLVQSGHDIWVYQWPAHRPACGKFVSKEER